MDAPPIELVYFSGCPHVGEARAALRAALEAAGLPAAWREWDQTHPVTPARVLGYGSPTVLIVFCSGYTARHGTAGASTPRPRSVPNWTG